MYDRRRFVTGLGLLLTSSVGAHAQPVGKLPRVGYLFYGSPGPSREIDAFRQGLRELGYIEGQSIAVEYRFASGQVERYPELAAELVRLKVDVIVAPATPQALARVAVLYNPTDRSNVLVLKQLQESAPTLGLILQPLEVREPREFEGAFVAMSRERAHAMFGTPGALTFEHGKVLVDLAAKHRIPTMWGHRSFVDAGGLMSYAVNLYDQNRQAAVFVDKILKGTKPGDLPVEQPTKFELVINLRPAKALGLTIPPLLLVRADQVIE